MKNKTLLILIAVVIVLGIVLFTMVFTGKQTTAPTTEPVNENATVNSNSETFLQDFVACKVNQIVGQGADPSQTFTASILGIENGKCHYKLDVGGSGVDCLFPSEALSDKLLNQLFGNAEGLEDVVATSCTPY
ncbi:MAG: hypothetical protein NTW73_03480 [Candidatus Parcubacteria bacterium]|nr:hypothetical protein [Candidatus Parcubacteria bacterium]